MLLNLSLIMIIIIDNKNIDMNNKTLIWNNNETLICRFELFKYFYLYVCKIVLHYAEIYII